MMDQQDSSTFTGKIKAQILRQIFKDVTKNFKNVNHFFIICSAQQLEMRFITNPHDILLTIILKRNNFVSYKYSQEKPTLRKYGLTDFGGIPIIFENNKQILDLSIDNYYFTLIYYSQNGKFSKFRDNNLNCDHDDEDLLSNLDKDRQEEETHNCMELIFKEASMFQSILRYSKAYKLQSLWMKFNSVNQSLEVADKDDKPDICWQLKVESIGKDTLNFHHQMPFSSFGCALNFLPNHSQLKLTVYSGCMIVQSLGNENTLFDIKISAIKEKND